MHSVLLTDLTAVFANSILLLLQLMMQDCFLEYITMDLVIGKRLD